MTDKDLEAYLHKVLVEHNATHCPNKHKITLGSLSWNNGETKYGTPYGTVNLICEVCSESIVKINTWSAFETIEEVIYALDGEWSW